MRSGMRWWPPHLDPRIIITRHKEALPIGPHYQVSPKSFFVTCSNNTHPSYNSPDMSLIGSLASASQPHLLDLSTNISLSPFVNYLCNSTSNTPSNILDYYLHQMPYYKIYQTPNQLPTLHVPWLIWPIITHLASLATWRRPCHIKTTNWICLIAAIKNLIKKRYIRLTKTQ